MTIFMPALKRSTSEACLLLRKAMQSVVLTAGAMSAAGASAQGPLQELPQAAAPSASTAGAPASAPVTPSTPAFGQSPKRDVPCTLDEKVLLPSGASMTQLEGGRGVHPTLMDIVKINYRVSLLDGRVLDSSVARGGASMFKLNRAPLCVSQALMRMKPGGTAKVVCPAKAAYGTRGTAWGAPPSSVVLFDLELISHSGKPLVRKAPGHQL